MAEQTFLERSRYFLRYEYPTKIRLAVAPLTEELVWRRPNEESNSIANLLLHLTGNVGEWILSGVGGRQVQRYRAGEFEARDGPAVADLLAGLESRVREADDVLAALTSEDLPRSLSIQGRETTVLGAVYHVVEHFSMHTGQILMLAKILAPGSVRFYEDAGGLAVPLWGGAEGSGHL